MPTRLDRIINERLFRPVFQPIVDLKDELIIGMEALTRLDFGIPVLDCLEDAEELGVRSEVELAFLEVALEHTPYIHDAWVSVNVSPSVLLEHCDTIGALIDRSSVPVVLELTENEPIRDYHGIRRALSCLGPTTRLCLDDIGTGYAYIQHVVRMQAEYIKLDRSWTDRLTRDPTAALVVSALVEICEQFGMTLIAEGVETPDQLGTLQKLGVRHAQGYLLGYPAPLPTTTADPSVHPRGSEPTRLTRP